MKTKNSACTLHTIRMEAITSEVENRIRQLISAYADDEDNKQELLEHLYDKDEMQKEIKKKSASLNSMEQKKGMVAKSLSTAYMDKVSGNLSEAHFQVLRSNFDDDIQRIESEMDILQNVINDIEKKLTSLEVNVLKIENYIGFPELTHEIVNDFVDYIEVGEKTPDGKQAMNIHWLL
jgi:gas vesicle protein